MGCRKSGYQCTDPRKRWGAFVSILFRLVPVLGRGGGGGGWMFIQLSLRSCIAFSLFPIVPTGPFVAHSLIFLSGTHRVSGRGHRAGPSSS
ncbi:hypothetical protein LguiB_013369 [Lonicera macranthoides]